LKEKTWAFKTTNSVSSERKKCGHFKRQISVSFERKNVGILKQQTQSHLKEKNVGILNNNLWQLLKEKMFFHFQDTNTKCRRESIRFSIAKIPIQNEDINQFIFPLPEYQYKMQT
jgi:hypothetical protein